MKALPSVIVAAVAIVVVRLALAADPAAVSQPTTVPASQPASQATSQSTSQPAASASAWPPGLIMEGLNATEAKSMADVLGLRLWGYTEAGFTGDLTNGQRTLFGRVFDSQRPTTFSSTSSA